MTQIIDGRYEVIQALSAGGFGITFLAKDLRRPGQPRCVVKQLRPQREFSADEWQVARRLFDQEAEILERLGCHDQIPLLLAHLQENGEFYIVQDFIEGRTFRDELLATKRLPEKDVITLLRQGLTVLSYVHQQGVIHRDIKPENLIHRRDGMLCLIDFGIVKEFSAQHLSYMASPQSKLVSTTVSIGTQGYIPLEQIRGKPCPASDVYALGMVAIEALTGKFPAEFDTDPATAEVIWQTGIQLSPALAKVLTQMVRHHYSRRYANGAEALQALETALAPVVPTVVVSPKALTTPAQPPSKSRLPASAKPSSRRRVLQIGGLVGGAIFIAVATSRWPFSPAESLVTRTPAPDPTPLLTPTPIPEADTIDYSTLESLLQAGNWHGASQETLELMRQVAKGGFSIDLQSSIENFPCEDLQRLDDLWVQYSDGKFGFSVQARIWQEVGSPMGYGEKFEKFGDRVGWRKDSQWQGLDSLVSDLTLSPAGELPYEEWYGYYVPPRFIECSK